MKFLYTNLFYTRSNKIIEFKITTGNTEILIANAFTS